MLHQLPPDLAKKDADSRARWSVAAYLTLAQQLSHEGLQALIAAGKEKFVADARLAYRRQDFRDDDYERIWCLLNHRLKELDEQPWMQPTIHG